MSGRLIEKSFLLHWMKLGNLPLYKDKVSLNGFKILLTKC